MQNRLYAGKPAYPAVPVNVGGESHHADVGGDNPTGGDNQQGRPRRSLTPDYVAGFIDGEGCFSVSVHPHPSIRHSTRWLIAPCFQAYQHRDNVEILEDIMSFFGCGRITSKGPKSTVMTYSVYRRRDLESVIVPFFEQHRSCRASERTSPSSRRSFVSCRRTLIELGEGFRRIVELAFSMNQRGKQRRYSSRKC